MYQQPLAPSPNGSTHGDISPMLATGALITFAVDEEVREREENGWEYSAYSVVSTYQGQSYTVQRRYKEFKQLHAQLRVHAPTLPANFPIWPNLLNRYAPAVVEERKVGFQRYLADALQSLDGKPIPAVLRNFLQLPPPVTDSGMEGQQPSLMVPSQLEATDTVVLVSYALPLNVTRDAAGGFVVTWDDNSVLNRLALNLPTKVLWVGCVSLEVATGEQEMLAELLLEEYNW